MRTRARVLGAALRTPLGASAAEIARGLAEGRRAARENPRFDVSGYACTLAAPVGDEPPASRGTRFLRRLARLGLVVAREAMRDAGGAGGDRVGLFAAVGGLRAPWDDLMPALERQRPDGDAAWESGLRRIHPFWMLSHLSNNAHALLSIELGLRGEGATFGGATAGAEALCAATRALAAGAIDAALVVAYDSLLEPETLVELAARGDVTSSRLPALGAPYGPEAAGAVPGEAAAAVWIERGDAGRLVEARATADGARGLPEAATLARIAAGLCDGVGLVDGAASARPALDAAERAALAPLLPPSCPLLATAASLGALGAATSLVQAIVLAELLERGELPPIAGLGEPTPGPLRPLLAPERTTARAALGLSCGAPGLAAAVRVEIVP